MENLYEATTQEWFEEFDCIVSAIDSINWDEFLAPGSVAHLLDARRLLASLCAVRQLSADDNAELVGLTGHCHNFYAAVGRDLA